MYSTTSLSSLVSEVADPPPRLHTTSLPPGSWHNRTGHVEKVGSGRAYFVSEHAERGYFRPEQEGLSSDRSFPVVPKMQDGDVTRLFATQEAAEADFVRRHPTRPGEPLVTFDSDEVNVNNVRIAVAADNYAAPSGPVSTDPKLPPSTADHAHREIHVRTQDIDTSRIRHL